MAFQMIFCLNKCERVYFSRRKTIKVLSRKNRFVALISFLEMLFRGSARKKGGNQMKRARRVTSKPRQRKNAV